MRELLQPERLPRNERLRTYRAGSLVVDTAFEAERLGKAIQTATRSEAPWKITHPKVDHDGTGREIEVFHERTRDESEFYRRSWGAAEDLSDRGHGPLVLEPEVAELAKQGLELCVDPTALREEPIEKHVSQSVAQVMLDILENRIPQTEATNPLRSVA